MINIIHYRHTKSGKVFYPYTSNLSNSSIVRDATTRRFGDDIRQTHGGFSSYFPPVPSSQPPVVCDMLSPPLSPNEEE